MDKEITIIAVKYDDIGLIDQCIGCVSLKKLMIDCIQFSSMMKVLGLPNCNDGYIYKLKEN